MCKVNDANVKLSLYNFIDKIYLVNYDCRNVWFDNNRKYIHRTTALTANNLLNQHFGFVRGTQMKTAIDISILEVEGFHQPVVMNHRVPPEHPMNSFVFAYPEDKLYCSKEIMDIICEMNCDRKVSAAGQFQLHIASSEPLEEFLDCLYGSPIPIHGLGRIKDVLNVAERFKMRAVIQRFATAVIQNAGVNEVKQEFLKLAVQRNMRRVVHFWLSRMQSINKEDIVNLGVHRMSGEIMKAIVKRVLELGCE
ncbi:hypothetical protein GCK72_011907 [Caenorhabditis remanei]|uniref:BTB domain-containing protein n=1 Tax=Caenorhabditis remanei TaxID=31234 RepID=A0A6A5H734_CAERE|nr:hypothetical protein GCK72_011907 [Caenorhabditis remanei]KAF1763640.1 hypothetical protein GCK72_011907 [Caenorhabditis remanei]